MLIEQRNLYRYIRIVIAVIVSIMIVANTNSMVIHLFVIMTISFMAVIESKFNFSHPYSWFSVFFFLYNCAYSIILIIAPWDSAAKGYDSLSSVLIVTALAVSLIVNNPGIKQYDYTSLPNPEFYNLDIQLLNGIMVGFTILQLVCIILLKGQGITSKSEQWMVHNMFWIVATYCTRFNTYILAILVFMGDNLKKRWKIITFSAILTLYFSLLTGERDAILRMVIVLIIALAMIGKIKFRQLIIIGPAGVASMIALNYFKYYLSTGSMNRDTFTLANTLYEFLYSDFVDCGSNLQTLINSDMAGCQGFSCIFKDILSSVFPSSIMNGLFGNTTNWNVSEWYNNYFYAGSTWNRAFTLVGEGYVMGGILGVIVLFLILGLLIRSLYKRSDRSPYFAAIYVYGAVAIISAFRGDASTIFSYIIRVPIFVTVILWAIKNVIRHRNGEMMYEE